MKGRNKGIPPNMEFLDPETQQTITEEVYAARLHASHGYGPEDPCLKSNRKVQDELRRLKR